jgi:hypothetical protein
MTRSAGKFSANFRITLDERAQLAEELMASVDRDDDDDELDFRREREEFELRYAADEEPPVSEDRWDHAQVRLTRSS